MESSWESVEIDAESEDDAEDKFNSMCADDIMDRAGVVTEFSIDEVEEVK